MQTSSPHAFRTAKVDPPKETAGVRDHHTGAVQVVLELVRLGSPVAGGFILQSTLQIITVSYAGRLGDTQLAVAGLG